MQSITPEHPLVNQTSPFVLSIYGGVDQFRLYLALAFLTFILLLPLSVQTLVSASFAAFILLALYACSASAASAEKTVRVTGTLILSADGYCRFGRGSVLKLLKSSRVGFAGCWLMFTDKLNGEAGEEQNQGAACARFIFKDSLSAQDFARLSRVVFSLKLAAKGAGLESRRP